MYESGIPAREAITRYAEYRSFGKFGTVFKRVLNRIARLIAVSEGKLVAVSCVIQVHNSTSVTIYADVLIRIAEGEALKALLIARSVNRAVGFSRYDFAFLQLVFSANAFYPMLNG